MPSPIPSTSRISDPQLRRCLDSVIDTMNGNTSTGFPSHTGISNPASQRCVIAIYEKLNGSSTGIPATLGVDAESRQVLDAIIQNI
jgi:hypothetical protein